ncbi:MAG: N-acetyl sugar amidotransferase [Nitrospirae bacterium]|nr:N-acetyl sugar amidotransferase [Nitrospirota bacterium]
MKLGKVKYCKKCVMPSSSAVPVEFDDAGICSGCRVSEQKYEIDWERRHSQLKVLLDSYRSKDNSNYDCIIPVSGGKDSYFQTHIIKNIFGINPLLVTYNANNYTEPGMKNLINMRNVFGVDHIFFTPSVNLLKRMNRLCFSKMGDMNWHAHCGIFTYPIIVSVKFNIPLIIWGEHGFMDMGGMHSYSDYVEFTYRFRHEHGLRGYEWYDMINDEKEPIKGNELLWAKYPSDEDIKRVGVRGIYISNYVRWNPNEHTKLVIDKYGFIEYGNGFDRTYRKTSNLDDMHENGIHDYMKYIKFGYGRATDHACKDIRDGLMSRDEGIEMVKKYDQVKPKDLYRWLDYVEMNETEFDTIADSFRDKRVWERLPDGSWVKDNIWD